MGQLWPYVSNKDSFYCLAEKAKDLKSRRSQGLQDTTSYVMNGVVGKFSNGWFNDKTHKRHQFESEDVLATAHFIEIHDNLFDILNSRSTTAPAFKKALTVDNFHHAKVVFDEGC